VHASWLDQAEIYFSIVQRKVLNPNDFTNLGQIRDRLAAFEIRYNAIARPFSWKFTRTRPRRPAAPHRRPRGTAIPATRGVISTPDELTGETTKALPGHGGVGAQLVPAADRPGWAPQRVSAGARCCKWCHPSGAQS